MPVSDLTRRPEKYYLISVKMASGEVIKEFPQTSQEVKVAVFSPFDVFEVMTVSTMISNENEGFTLYECLDVRESAVDQEHSYNSKVRQTILLAKPIPEADDKDKASEEKERIKKCFFYGENEPHNISDKPFLGLITVMIRSEFYNEPGFYAKGYTPQDMFQFYEDERANLEKIIRNLPEINNNKLEYDVCMTMTTGDLCVVLRAGSPDSICEIAARIRNEQPSGIVKYDTFTSINMECRQKKDNVSYCNIDDIGNNPQLAQELGKSPMVLRFSALHRYVEEFIELCKDFREAEQPTISKHIEFYKPRMLCGEFDLTVRIPFKDYNRIYPALCYHKFKGHQVSPDCTCGCSMERKNPVCYICQGILDGNITVLNERYFHTLIPLKGRNNKLDAYTRSDEIGVSEGENINNATELRIKKIKDIEQENERIQSEIVACSLKEKNLVDVHKNFRYYMRSLQVLFKTYANLGHMDDTYINWKIFAQQMYVILNGLNTLFEDIENIPDIEGKKEISGYILDQLRVAIQSIDSFQNCLQAINKLSMQSPSYELQNRVDMEKFAVAYFQFSQEYLRDFSNILKINNLESDIKHLPLIFIDPGNPMIQVFELFNKRYISYDQAKSSDPHPVLLSISMRTTENFAKLYFLLPFLVHEYSHFLQYRTKTLNACLARFVYIRLAKTIMNHWMKENDLNFNRPITSIDEDLSLLLAKHLYQGFSSCKIIDFKDPKDSFLEQPHSLFWIYFREYLLASIYGDKIPLQANKSFASKLLLQYLDGLLSYYPVNDIHTNNTDKAKSVKDVKEIIVKLKSKIELTNMEDLEKWQEEVKGIDGDLLKIVRIIAVCDLDEQYKACFLGYIENDTDSLLDKELKNMLKKQEEMIIHWFEKPVAFISIVDCEKELKKLYERIYDEISKNNNIGEYETFLRNLEFYLAAVASIFYYKNAIEDLVKSDKALNEPCYFPINWKELQREFQDYICNVQKNPTRHASSFLFTSQAYYPYVRQILVAPENFEMFQKDMSDVIFEIGQENLEQGIRKSETLFSEITADLTMCAYFSFDAFGYLKYMINANFPLLDKKYLLNIERICIVLAVLLEADRTYQGSVIQTEADFSQSPVQADNLFEKINKYIQALLGATKNQLVEKLQNYPQRISVDRENAIKKGLSNYFEILESALKRELSFEATKQGERQALEDNPYDKLLGIMGELFDQENGSRNASEIRTSICHRASTIIKLKNMVELARKACPNKEIMMDGYLRQELKVFYLEVKEKLNNTQTKELCESNLTRNNAINKGIGDYYNKVDVSTVNKRERDYKLFCDSLSFVWEYYYRNRFEYARIPCDQLDPSNKKQMETRGN